MLASPVPGTVRDASGPARGDCGVDAVSRSEHELSHPPPYPGQLGSIQSEMLDAASPNGSAGPYWHAAHQPQTGDGSGGNNAPPRSSACMMNPFAFVAALAVELSFVLGIVVLAKLSPARAVDAAAYTTAISVAGFYSRHAMVTIGRRLVGTADHDRQ